MSAKYGKHWGTETELRACAWLLGQGYEVFRNVSAFGVIDIVAVKDGEIRYIDVKSTAQGNLNGTPTENEKVEVLYPLPDGSFRFRKKRSRIVMRKATPREEVLAKLCTGLIDDGR